MSEPVCATGSHYQLKFFALLFFKKAGVSFLPFLTSPERLNLRGQPGHDVKQVAHDAHVRC